METLLEQTVSDWELIICDSHSWDGSTEYLEAFVKDSRIRMYPVPREGPYAGWNECLKRATGKYVYIATADDTCDSLLLERMVQALERPEESRQCQRNGGEGAVRNQEQRTKNKELFRPLDIAVCDYRVLDENGRTLKLDLNRNPREFYGTWMSSPHIRNGLTEFVIHASLGIVWVTMTAVLFRRSLLDRIGLFRTDRGAAADQEWQLRACLASDIAYIPEKLATWRMHARQVTAKTREKYFDVNVLRSLEAVADDADAGIPEGWKETPGWREEILAVQRSLYRDSFTLYGNVAKRDPGRFLKHMARALVCEPGLLLTQISRGFRWDEEFSVDGFRQVKKLINTFGCPWPPTAVGLR